MQGVFGSLSVTALNPEQHAKTCGYWYTVTSGACAHTAFATKEGLQRWMDERGLSVQDIPVMVRPEDYGKGLLNHCRIEGGYIAKLHMNKDVFYGLENVVCRSKTLSNGDYVEAIITEENGVRTVHTLNPNVYDRPTFDYFETRKLMS